MKMTNGNQNNIEDISTDNLYKLLERTKGGDYEAQRQCIEKELASRLNQMFANAVDTNAINNLSDEQVNQVADILKKVK
jgi:hypothetical protein